MAKEEGRVCVFLEPIARYHTRDLHDDGDNGWLAPYRSPADTVDNAFGHVKAYGHGADVLLVTFGNGLFMSLRAARALAAEGIGCTVVDLRWLAPLPEASLMEHIRAFDRILIADETRSSGGVSEAVIALAIDNGYRGSIKRVTSVDSFIPLGAAADHVLLSEEEIVRGARDLALAALQSSATQVL
jgi:2-oxoisovalerate dehydrogenase E1 component